MSHSGSFSNHFVHRYLGSRIIMAAMEPKPKKLLENVVLKFKNIKVSKIKSDESKERLFGNALFLFHLTAIILFSDRRKGEELYVLERLQP